MSFKYFSHQFPPLHSCYCFILCLIYYSGHHLTGLPVSRFANFWSQFRKWNYHIGKFDFLTDLLKTFTDSYLVVYEWCVNLTKLLAGWEYMYIFMQRKSLAFIRLLLCWLKSEFLITFYKVCHNLAPPCLFIFLSPSLGGFMLLNCLQLSYNHVFKPLYLHSFVSLFWKCSSLPFCHYLLVILCD